MSERPKPFLQHDLFSEERVDTRTAAQKRREAQATLPQQTELFSPREVLQFGVNGRPSFPVETGGELILEREDPRTEEEKERDRWRIAEEQTYSLFAQNAEPTELELQEYEYLLFHAALVAGFSFPVV